MTGLPRQDTATIALVGRPRLLAGCSEVTVRSGTLAEVLAQLPAGLEVCRGEQIASPFLVSLDGRDFVRDTQIVIEPGTRVILLDSSAGG